MTQLFEKTGTNIVFAMPPAGRIKFGQITGATYQDGSGDVLPDNVRTISGTTTLTASDGGSNSQVITLPQTIYSLPDGAADSYDVVSGDGTQKIGKVVLDGSGTWVEYGALVDDTYYAAYRQIVGMKQNVSVNIVSDRFVSAPYLSLKENIYGGTGSQYGIILIRIQKSRLLSSDISGMKTWLSSNPVTVLYELATPVEITGTAIGPITLPAGQANVTTDGGGTVSLSVYNEWTDPKTGWTANDYFNLDPDYARIKENIEYIKEFSEAMYDEFSIAEMGDFTIDELPFDTFLNNIVDNVTALEENLFKPPQDQNMSRYSGGGNGWDYKQLNIIESNLLRLKNAMQSQWNCIPQMAFSMGTGADEF